MFQDARSTWWYHFLFLNISTRLYCIYVSTSSPKYKVSYNIWKLKLTEVNPLSKTTKLCIYKPHLFHGKTYSCLLLSYCWFLCCVLIYIKLLNHNIKKIWIHINLRIFKLSVPSSFYIFTSFNNCSISTWLSLWKSFKDPAACPSTVRNSHLRAWVLKSSHYFSPACWLHVKAWHLIRL